MANRGSIQKGWRNIPIFGKAVVLPDRDYNAVMDLRDWAVSESETFTWAGEGGAFGEQRRTDEKNTRNDAQRIVAALDRSRRDFTSTSGRNLSKELWGMLVVRALKSTGIEDIASYVQAVVEAAYERKYRRGVRRSGNQRRDIQNIIHAIHLDNIDVDAEIKAIKGTL